MVSLWTGWKRSATSSMEEYLSVVEMVFHQGEKLPAENVDFGSRPCEDTPTDSLSSEK
ncbi:hypothetical protein NIES2100_17830 [Calothrix sp. NIES-2100]|nr:hypothetical protein NIES2100_17830 [Calothrix sp. NIES-2100]